MKNKERKQNQESGQALITGLFFLIFTLLFFCYFIYFSETVERYYANHETAKRQALAESSRIANTLNQIAINNQNIIAAIAESQNAFTIATELGLYLSYHQPYWETRAASQRTVHKGSLANGLSLKTEQTLTQDYNGHALSSARGFFIAKSLADKNQRLLQNLPQNIAQFFKRTTNAQTHCLALATQAENYHPHAMISLPFSLYNFDLAQQNCQISHPRSVLSLPIPPNIPFFTSGESDTILSYEKIDSFQPTLSDIHYGISYVPLEQSLAFILSLKQEVRTPVRSQNKAYQWVEKYLSEIPFFKELKKENAASPQFYNTPHPSLVRISHPKIICENGRSFLTEKDWETMESCSLKANSFLSAFFLPHWTALLTFQEMPLL